MRDRALRLAWLAALTLAAPLAAQQVDLAHHLRFEVDETETAARPGAIGVDIDKTIAVLWNERSLSLAIGVAEGIVPQQSPLRGRIEYLSGLVEQFLAAQARLSAFNAAAARLARARAADAPTSQIDRLVTERNDASNALASVAGLAIEAVVDADRHFADLARAEELQNDAETILLTHGDSAYKGLSDAFADAVSAELVELERELRVRLRGDSLQVFMDAWLLSSGASRPLHLDGYDDISTGLPQAFPRIQLALSERTARELEAAERLGSLVESSEDLKDELAAAARVLEDAASGVLQAIQSDVLEPQLEDLIERLRSAPGQVARPLIRQAERALSELRTIGAATGTGGPGSATAIAPRAVELLRGLRGVTSTVPLLADRLTGLANDLSGHLDSLPDLVQQQVLDLVRDAGSRLLEDDAIQAVLARAREVAATFGLTVQVAGVSEAVGTIGRSATGQALDTSVELLTAGERHPGDDLVIRARLVRRSPEGRETVVARTSQRFTLRKVGLHVAPRGALFFVDPQDAAFASQRFEPAVGISFVAHWGLKNSALWNDLLDPGVALSAMLLDFSDTRDIEVGLGVTFTLFRDLLSVGYGRNLQAETDVFYIGVNPLAFGDFLRGSVTRVPGGI